MQLVVVVTIALLAATCSVGHAGMFQFKHACFMMMTNESDIVKVADRQLAANCTIEDDWKSVVTMVRVSLITNDSVIRITFRSKPQLLLGRDDNFTGIQQKFDLEWGNGNIMYRLVMDVELMLENQVYESDNDLNLWQYKNGAATNFVSAEYNDSLPPYDQDSDLLLTELNFTRLISYNTSHTTDLALAEVKARLYYADNGNMTFIEKSTKTTEPLFPLVATERGPGTLRLILMISCCILLVVVVGFGILIICLLTKKCHSKRKARFWSQTTIGL